MSVVEYEELMMFISFSGQILVLCKLNTAFIISKLYHVYQRLYGLLMGNKIKLLFHIEKGPKLQILEVYNVFIFYPIFPL